MNSHQWHRNGSHATLTVNAKNETGLFMESQGAIIDLMNPVSTEAVAPIVNLDLKGKDMADLLTQFLTNVITWSEKHKADYNVFAIHEMSHNHLVGILEGNIADSFEHMPKINPDKPVQIKHGDSGQEKHAPAKPTHGWMVATIEFSL